MLRNFIIQFPNFIHGSPFDWVDLRLGSLLGPKQNQSPIDMGSAIIGGMQNMNTILFLLIYDKFFFFTIEINFEMSSS